MLDEVNKFIIRFTGGVLVLCLLALVLWFVNGENLEECYHEDGYRVCYQEETQSEDPFLWWPWIW